jgi:hypothetical protein
MPPNQSDEETKALVNSRLAKGDDIANSDALIDAASQGKTETVKLLIEKIPGMVYALRGGVGHKNHPRPTTVFHEICKSAASDEKTLEIIELALAKPGSHKQTAGRLEDGKTLSEIAAARGKTKTAAYLLQQSSKLKWYE